jgi:peptidoglycan/LPS O-acetylase OafA/YrhL
MKGQKQTRARNKVMRLGDFAYQKNNNLNLMRLLAALLVSIAHGFSLTGGPHAWVPFKDALGLSVGSMAVDVFFIVSGFLVTASLMRTESLNDYVWGRALRIFPGLLVMLIIVVFGIGSFLSNLPIENYLTHSQTYTYLIKNASLVTGADYYLPGVFLQNPYKGAVNGSLWTIPLELKMYGVVAACWLLACFFADHKKYLFKGLLIGCAVLSGLVIFYLHWVEHRHLQSLHLFFMFFTGACFFVFRNRIFLTHSVFLLLTVACGAAAFAGVDIFFIPYIISLSYIVFYLAYIPSGIIKKYNAVGDYSYGFYIYSFPIQQLIVRQLPEASAAEVIAMSLVATLLVSVLSWHLIEKRAMTLKKPCVRVTENLLLQLKNSVRLRKSNRQYK